VITQEKVRGLFDYKDGQLIRIKPGCGVKIGSIAGNDGVKYARTGIEGKLYLNHRIIFLWHNGFLPEFLDHKWCASIQVGGKRHHIGLYDSKLKASEAYQQRAKKEFGEYNYGEKK